MHICILLDLDFRRQVATSGLPGIQGMVISKMAMDLGTNAVGGMTSRSYNMFTEV